MGLGHVIRGSDPARQAEFCTQLKDVLQDHRFGFGAQADGGFGFAFLIETALDVEIRDELARTGRLEAPGFAFAFHIADGRDIGVSYRRSAHVARPVRYGLVFARQWWTAFDITDDRRLGLHLPDINGVEVTDLVSGLQDRVACVCQIEIPAHHHRKDVVIGVFLGAGIFDYRRFLTDLGDGKGRCAAQGVNNRFRLVLNWRCITSPARFAAVRFDLAVVAMPGGVINNAARTGVDLPISNKVVFVAHIRRVHRFCDLLQGQAYIEKPDVIRLSLERQTNRSAVHRPAQGELGVAISPHIRCNPPLWQTGTAINDDIGLCHILPNRPKLVRGKRQIVVLCLILGGRAGLIFEIPTRNQTVHIRRVTVEVIDIADFCGIQRPAPDPRMRNQT